MIRIKKQLTLIILFVVLFSAAAYSADRYLRLSLMSNTRVTTLRIPLKYSTLDSKNRMQQVINKKNILKKPVLFVEDEKENLLVRLAGETSSEKRLAIAKKLNIGIATDMLDVSYLFHDMEIKRIVNPDDDPEYTAVYLGAAYDVINFMRSFNARIGYFMAFYQDGMYGALGKNKEVTARFKEYFENLSQDKIEKLKQKNAPGLEYRFKNGLSLFPNLMSLDHTLEHLALDFYGIGADVANIKVDEEKGHPRIKFQLKYPGNKKEWYAITFVSVNLAYPPIYEPVIDELISDKSLNAVYLRAGQNLVSEYSSNVSQRLGNIITFLYEKKMKKRKSYFVTDDIAGASPGSPDMSDKFPIKLPEIEVPYFQLIKKACRVIRIDTLKETDYGLPQHIREVVPIVDQELRDKQIKCYMKMQNYI
ncbi:hypothetical protein ACFL2G_00260 [Candidatus Omnitrophota bacterium]